MAKSFNREDIPFEYQWDLKSLCKDDLELKNKIKCLKKEIPIFKSWKGKLGQSKSLLEFMNHYVSFGEQVDKMDLYLKCRIDEDLSKTKYQKLDQELMFLIQDFSIETSYFEFEIVHLGEEKLKLFFEEEPKLKEYQKFLLDIAHLKGHVFSESKEELITNLTANLEDIHQVYRNLLFSEIKFGAFQDEDGNEVLLTVGNYSKYIASSNREVRKNVYELYHNRVRENANSLTGLMITYLKTDEAIAKVRNFKNSLESDAFYHEYDLNILSVFKKTAFQNRELYTKYTDLMKRVLKLDVLKPYDLHVPWVSNNKEYSVVEAQILIYHAVGYLGLNYQNRVQEVFKHRLIDYYPCQNKVNSAYCASIFGEEPRILLNYNGKFDDVSSLIHELGHAVQHLYSNETCNFTNIDTSYMFAEIPSLTNEFLLTNYILEHGTKEEKLLALYNAMYVFIGNFYETTWESDIEEFIHQSIEKKISLDFETIKQECVSIIEKYYQNNVDEIEGIGEKFVRRNHYFTPFYLFKYAICVTISCVLAQKITSGDEETIQNYLEFLKMGGKMKVMDIYNYLGFDMTNRTVYEDAIHYFERLMNHFEELYFDNEVK